MKFMNLKIQSNQFILFYFQRLKGTKDLAVKTDLKDTQTISKDKLDIPKPTNIIMNLHTSKNRV